MNDATKVKAGWKQKVVAEFIEYWVVVAYLFWFFAVFTWYRRFVLAEYHISYAHYSFALVEALVLAKLILIGDALRFGQKLDHKPLIVPTLWKAAVFSLWVAVFSILEHTVEGLLRHQGLAAGFGELASTGKYELLARCLVMFSVFIPFFACKELGRILGEGQLLALFFRGARLTGSWKQPLHPPTGRT
jgi:hypothetical protein